METPIVTLYPQAFCTICSKNHPVFAVPVQVKFEGGFYTCARCGASKLYDDYNGKFRLQEFDFECIFTNCSLIRAD